MPQFYVYVFLDPRKKGVYKFGEFEFDYEPFYIGKGQGNRIDHHIKYYKITTNNRCKINKINKIIRLGYFPILLKVKDNLDEAEAFKIEKLLINLIGRYPNGPLTNMTDGGEGSYGLLHSEKTKKLLSEIHKTLQLGVNNPFYGKHHSKETIEKIRVKCRKASLGSKNAFYRKHHSKEMREKLSELKKKTYILISPDKQIYERKGMMEIANEFKLHYKTLTRFLDKGMIPLPKQKKKFSCIEIMNSVGWEVKIKE